MLSPIISSDGLGGIGPEVMTSRFGIWVGWMISSALFCPIRKFTIPTSLVILKSSKIFGFLKSSPTIIVFFPLSAKTVAMFNEQNVFPSPLIDEVSINVFDPLIDFFLYKNCNDDLMARNDSDNADFGFSKTDKLEVVCFFPTMPNTGIFVSREISSVFRIAFSTKKMANTNINGNNNPKKKAVT